MGLALRSQVGASRLLSKSPRGRGVPTHPARRGTPRGAPKEGPHQELSPTCVFIVVKSMDQNLQIRRRKLVFLPFCSL